MSLSINTTNFYEITQNATINNLSAFTTIQWITRTSVAAQGNYWNKSNANRLITPASPNIDEIQFDRTRATTSTQYITNNANMVINTMYCIALTFDSAGSSHIYLGTLTTPLTELTYATSVAGSGALTTEATTNLRIGNGPTAGGPLTGLIHSFQMFNRVLSLGELRSQQFTPQNDSGCVALHFPGFNGTTNVPDWSGNANTGTITGATLGAAFPLSSPFAFSDDSLYKTASVVNVTATPTTLADTLSFFAPVITAGALTAPSALSLVSSLFGPGFSLGLGVSPTTLSLSSLVRAPTFSTDQILNASSQSLLSALQNPSVSAAANAAPSTLGLTLGPWNPVEIGNALVQPSFANMTGIGGNAVVAADANYAPVTLALVINAPTATAGSFVVIAVTTLALTLTPQAPSISGASLYAPPNTNISIGSPAPSISGAANVLVNSSGILGTMQAVTIGISVDIHPSVLSLILSEISPTVLLPGATVINAAVLSALITVFSPVVTGDSYAVAGTANLRSQFIGHQLAISSQLPVSPAQLNTLGGVPFVLIIPPTTLVTPESLSLTSRIWTPGMSTQQIIAASSQRIQSTLWTSYESAGALVFVAPATLQLMQGIDDDYWAENVNWSGGSRLWGGNEPYVTVITNQILAVLSQTLRLLGYVPQTLQDHIETHLHEYESNSGSDRDKRHTNLRIQRPENPELVIATPEQEAKVLRTSRDHGYTLRTR